MIKKTFIISLGGSVILSQAGIEVNFLKKFRKLVLKYTKLGARFIIVTGGGVIARDYINSANEIKKIGAINSDWLGIAATKLNAQLLQVIFGSVADDEIIIDPTKKIKSDKQIIIVAGYKPGWSTDYDAILLANNCKIDTVINLSNIDYVYNKNPEEHDDAQKIEKISWLNFKKLVGTKWQSGLSSPFDPIASKLAAKSNITVVVMAGKDLINLDNYFKERSFKGTIIG